MEPSSIAKVRLLSTAKATDRVYDYLCPGTVPVFRGQVVKVPFGKGDRIRHAVVVDVKNEIPSMPLKAIAQVLPQEISLTEELLVLCDYLKEQIFCTFGDAAKAIIPAPVYQKEARTVRCLSLACGVDPETALSTFRGKNKEVYQSLLSYLALSGSAEEKTCKELFSLPAGTASFLEKKGLLTISEKESFRDPFADLEKESLCEQESLSPEQTEAFERLKRQLEEKGASAALLHGITGSGKTRVILALCDHVLKQGKTVLFLVPEIALTGQSAKLLFSRYGEKVAIWHSALSEGERRDTYISVKNGEKPIVLGTRSAVFAPLSRLGLVVLDEEQDQSYKSDTQLKYHARDVARFRCVYHNAMLLLASATPDITSYHKAVTGKYRLITMNHRYGAAKLPTVEICDMRGETSRGNLSPIGEHLEARLREDKKNGNQSILFLNRRGYNNYVSCRTCGHSIKCPNCSVTLTYHSKSRLSVPKDDPEFEKYRRENGYLVCHTCGYKTKVPDKCPDCGKEHFLFMGCGTQRAEDDIISMFPDLRVLRMDFDTTQKKQSHEEILSQFRAGEADVLLGTQMVTKGHDFPKVATVGVLNADSSLTLDDYRAGERTFAMLTQVIGRAGRADVPGRAIIQTYNPDNEVILMAAHQDYARFYEGEIKLRRALMFPPFCDIAVITLSSADEGYLGLVTNRMYERIIERTRADFSDVPVVLYGPFEAPVYRVQNVCRMRFVMKCRINRRTREFFSELMSEFAKFTPGDVGVTRNFTKTSRKITVSVDLNPSTV